MTQSGRGEEPSARPAREGIVLPSDGGEPLLPGMIGGQSGQPTSVPAAPPATPQPSAPPGGQSWGSPWGPEQTPPAQSPQPPAAPGQTWGTPPGQSWGGQQEQQQPYPGGHAGASPSPAPWGAAPDAAGGTPSESAQPLPPEGVSYGGGAQGTPSYGQGAPAGGAPLPARQQYPQQPQQPQPPYGQGGGPSAPLPPAGGQAYGAPGFDGALPPAQQGGQSAPMPPAGPGAGGFGAPLPPADEGATQYIPPVAAPPAPVADEGVTQYIPPVGPGALPPEVPGESTQILGRARQGGGAGPQGGAGAMPAAASGTDADATQYIPPVTGQPGGAAQPGPGRQPLSDFDNLFRSEPGGEPPAAATQQLPRFQQPQPQPQGPRETGYFPPGPHGQHGHHGQPGSHGPNADDIGGGGRGGRRTGSRVPLMAAVGVGIAVLGIGAGAMLAGGGGDDQKSDDNRPVSATAPATEGSPSPSEDPAEQQAIALDKLLADSGDSRTTVIKAVAAVKSCGNLPQAATDLRGAAKQRNQLVTDLSKLSVDQLPSHTELTTALTKAWQASASADNHYAAWADQVAAKKGQLCKKGQARSTGQTQAGNRASGTASAEKKAAAQLWNTIAKKYGLTERQPTQL
ncbi:hypothetical protein [Streptomyces viridochromogenes]|uniref:hypothetical protein n=1 Tax=Streptomyces viridochromogenes TaxID=1938 RepID=UPI00069EAF9E|nr:hypothetical protein [Streptomyces viridochromogenes]KOG14826.1 hypothetical protein ADK36_30185 [Streptomyces viridochromogenes]KOG15020.1 hypothetical protein ADK35_29830 [Streptomyces viridochromogenes]